jgi:hypothetical protein
LTVGAWALLLGVACTADGGSSSGSTAADSTLADSTTPTGSDTTAAVDDTASGPPVSVVTIDDWRPEEPAADPWAAERPADAVCELGWGPEAGVFEVDSELCTFGTFVQPTLAPVVAGATMELIMVHDALYSEDAGAVAHVAVALGGEIAWETEVPIPSLQDYLRPTFAAPLDAPAGTPVHFHVHNHGYNNYRVVDLTVR